MAESMGSPELGFAKAHEANRPDRNSGLKQLGRRFAGASGVFAALMLVAGMLQVATSLPAAAATPWFVAPASASPPGTLANCTLVTDHGTALAPCLLSHALTNAATGDTINLANGTYLAGVGADYPNTGVVPFNPGVNLTGASQAGTIINGASVALNDATAFISGTETISTLTITGNPGGSGLHNNSGTLTLTSVTISNNLSGGGSGGGIFNSPGASLVLTGDTISGNSNTASGGGIVNDGTITTSGAASTVTGNMTPGNGGGIENAIGGSLTATGLVVTSNTSTAGNGGGIANDSGALALSLTNGMIGGSSITGNVATGLGGNGGGIANMTTGASPTTTLSGVAISWNTAGTSGGGVYNVGSLSVSGGSISNNGAGAAGGGGLFTMTGALAAPPLLSNVTVDSNQTSGTGGGIHDTGVGGLVMTGGSLTNNVSTGLGGGGAFLMTTGALGLDTFGGSTPAAGVTISGNTAASVGGGIDDELGGLVVANDTVSGNTANSAVPFSAGGGIEVNTTAGGTCNVPLALPFSTATPPSNANNACVEYSTVADNHAPNDGGGGIGVDHGTLQVIGSTIGAPTTANGNNAKTQGAGINETSNTTEVSILNSSVEGNALSSTTGFGAGIAAGGVTTIAYFSTISGNTIEPFGASRGNGVSNNGPDQMFLTDDTIYGNQGASAGGGVSNTGVGATVTLSNDTISNNEVSATGGGAGIDNVGATATTQGTIFSADYDFTGSVTTVNDECAGTLPTSSGYNMDSGHLCLFVGPGDKSFGVADLGPLASNGVNTTTLGASALQTQTLALQSGSEAIGTNGVLNSGACTTFDQRGNVRRPGGRMVCDMGAYDTGGTGGGLTPTTTTVSVSPTSVAPGASVTYTATVSGGATPTGSVSFTAGGTATCIATLVGGTGSCTATNAPVGTSQPVVGTYGGDVGHSVSSGSTTLTVTGSLTPTTTTVTVSPSSTTQGTTVTYSATVAGGTTPTGTVTFTAAGAATCTATLSSGAGSCTASNAPVGTDPVVGTYVPDSTHSASSGSASLVVTGTSSPTSTSVSVSPGTVSQGGSVTYSATVTGGTTNPTGTVSFSAGGTSTCTATLSSGSGSCSATNAPVGTDPVIGTYTGDATHAASSGTATLTVTSPTPPPPVKPSGYDFVGSDGGVFVFPLGQASGFFGSLPALGIHVNNIVGMVPTFNDQGYFLVGSDGGVFAFGNAPFVNSLPGIGVHVNNIVGIIPTLNDQGYFLVGSDGGVFAFGNAPFFGSLPGSGVHVNNIVGIAATPDDGGYWVLASTGQVYGFGDAANFGGPSGVNNATAIVATPAGNGYWVVTANGAVFPFGSAVSFGSLPSSGVTPAFPIISIVPTNTGHGYWLIGADGGLFAYGDAPFQGSLPGLGTHVNNIVGAVPTG